MKIATAHNNSVSAPPYAALRFAPVLGPGTLSKRLITFAFLLRAGARGFWNIRSARTAPCGGQICASRKLQIHEHVMRNDFAVGSKMRFYPREKYTLIVKLSPIQILQRLDLLIQPRTFLAFPKQYDKPFEGIILGSQFSCSRLLIYTNPILPLIRGQIAPHPSGCLISIVMNIHPAFLAFAASLILLSANFVISDLTQSLHHARFPLMAALILTIVFSFYVLASLAFWYQVAVAKRYFSDLFKPFLVGPHSTTPPS